MATITSAGSGNWNAGGSWTGGSVPGAGDEAHIDSGHTITLTADASVGNVNIDGGTIAGGGYKITCVKTSGRLFDHSGTITGNLDLELQGTHNTTEDLAGTGNIRNLILNGSGLNVDIGRATTIAGGLTITQGTLTTSSSHHALTVSGGNLSVSGTLLLNNSTVAVSDTSSALSISNTGTVTCADTNLTVNALSMGQGAFTAPSASGSFIITGEKDGLAFDYDGNGFVHNSGTIDIRTQATTLVDFTPNSAADIDINNVIINHADCVATLPSAGGIGGDLTITAGRFDCAGYDLSVKSIAISAGATFSASSGTTTITGELASSGFALKNEGTFTHNNGTVKITTGATTHIMESNFYNLTITASSASYEITLRDSANNIITVFGDLTVESGRLCLNTTSDAMIIHGNTHVGADGTCWYDADQATDKITHHGLVTNLGTYKINDGTTVKMNGGIRQLTTLTID